MIFHRKKIETAAPRFIVLTKMSAFTTHSIIERLEAELEQQKAELEQQKVQMKEQKTENAFLKERLVGMTKQMTENRIANKNILNQLKAEISNLNVSKGHLNEIIDAREDDIAELKKQLDASNQALQSIKSNWDCAKQYTDDVISQHVSEIAELKKQLADQIVYTGNAITQASEVEDDLFMKNAQLQSQVDVMSEISERQASTMYEMEMKLQNTQNELNSQNTKFLATEGELFATKTHLDKANQMLTAIKTASSYINNVLSHRS
jgi:chromosome segregation ATPase